MIDYMNVGSISELTREEFLEFVKFLGHTPAKTEAEDDLWIDKFCDLAQHRKGSDVLFYPEPGKDSPEAMVEEVERYRRENGLPGFKDSDF